MDGPSAEPSPQTDVPLSGEDAILQQNLEKFARDLPEINQVVTDLKRKLPEIQRKIASGELSGDQLSKLLEAFRVFQLEGRKLIDVKDALDGLEK